MWLTLVALVVPLGLDTFAVGLLRLPVPVVVVLIGAQAFRLTQLGLRLGARIGEGIREGAERLAGVALAGLGLVLLGERLMRRLTSRGRSSRPAPVRSSCC